MVSDGLGVRKIYCAGIACNTFVYILMDWGFEKYILHGLDAIFSKIFCPSNHATKVVKHMRVSNRDEKLVGNAVGGL